MERNTFATSTYIETGMAEANAYLRDLRNLDEWTLYSNMIEQVDESTWRGTASGYHHDLYYHARPIETANFGGVEWLCGKELGEWYQCYPAIVLPAAAIGSDEHGVYFHWLSFVGPERATPMIMQGIDFVHSAEIRSLKAVLERRAGLASAARGRWDVRTISMFVDAPYDLTLEHLRDMENFADWSYFIRPDGAVGHDAGRFFDEYDKPLDVSVTIHDLGQYAILEFEHRYRQLNVVQRNLLFVVPCAYAFGNPEAQGCVHHRVAFFETDVPPVHGKLQLQDYGAEGMSVKRRLEHMAGNLESFGRGMSYAPAIAPGAPL